MNIKSIIDSDRTVSDKIRGLNNFGLERAEIARLLGKRYQHVRNVLEADQLKSPRRPKAEPAAASSRVQSLPDAVYRLTVDASGAVSVPPALIESLGLESGDILIADVKGDRIVLKTGKAALREAQALIRSIVPEGISLSDSLIEDRRRAAERGE